MAWNVERKSIMLRAIDISTTGLVAQRQRMNTIAGNIANANTTHDAQGNPVPYQRRLVRLFADSRGSAAGKEAAGVQYRVEVDTAQQPRRVHEPGNPYADKDGYVSYPNINTITEFVNALEAGRAYEANVAAIELSKQMASLSMRILA
jgi:flagellar basal-body rod protein FlgC